MHLRRMQTMASAACCSRAGPPSTRRARSSHSSWPSFSLRTSRCRLLERERSVHRFLRYAALREQSPDHCLSMLAVGTPGANCFSLVSLPRSGLTRSDLLMYDRFSPSAVSTDIFFYAATRVTSRAPFVPSKAGAVVSILAGSPHPSSSTSRQGRRAQNAPAHTSAVV